MVCACAWDWFDSLTTARRWPARAARCPRRRLPRELQHRLIPGSRVHAVYAPSLNNPLGHRKRARLERAALPMCSCESQVQARRTTKTSTLLIVILRLRPLPEFGPPATHPTTALLWSPGAHRGLRPLPYGMVWYGMVPPQSTPRQCVPVTEGGGFILHSPPARRAKPQAGRSIAALYLVHTIVSLTHVPLVPAPPGVSANTLVLDLQCGYAQIGGTPSLHSRAARTRAQACARRHVPHRAGA
jgi:hypothetical protein